MAFQSKDVLVLGQQLKVQEICLRADSPLISTDGGDLLISIGEDVSAALACIKQVAAGTITGVVPAVHSTPSQIKLTGEAGAAASTVYIVKYIVAE
jgi:hypothetical protein